MSLIEQLLAIEKDYFRYSEVAQAFGVTVRTVRRWVTDSTIPSVITPAGHHRIPRAELRATLQNKPPK